MLDVEKPQLLWDHELAAIGQNTADWHWLGFVARGNLPDKPARRRRNSINHREKRHQILECH